MIKRDKFQSDLFRILNLGSTKRRPIQILKTTRIADKGQVPMKFMDKTYALFSRVSLSDVVRICSIGYFLGAISLFLPVIIFFSLIGGFAGKWWEPVLFFMLFPLIIFMQGLIIGALIFFGTWIFRTAFHKKIKNQPEIEGDGPT